MSKHSDRTDSRSAYQRIEAQEQRKLAEQDEYREIIERAEAASDADAVRARLRELRWQGLLEVMRGQRFPPSHQDWEHWLGLSWDEIPQRRKLAALEDQELARRIHFYGEIAEHTERIKAMAVFAEAVGITDGPPVLHFWTQRAVLCELLSHAHHLQLPDGYDPESLEAMLQTIDLIGEALCQDPDSFATIGAELDRLIMELEDSE